MNLKLTILTLTLALCLTLDGLAVGFRFVDDTERLKALGFQITTLKVSDDQIRIFITPPYRFEVDKELGFKPFLSLALHDVPTRHPNGTATLGLPQASFPLACTKNREGKLETCITVLPRRSENLFLVFTFMHDAEGQWPIVVYVPVSSIITPKKQ